MGLPRALEKACETDGEAREKCLCGSCANKAVRQTCLRYTWASRWDAEGRELRDKGWVLAGCLPGTDCDAAFPAPEARRESDVVVSCPCRAPAPPPCPPPFPHGKGQRLTQLLSWVGIGAVGALVLWLLWKLLKRFRHPAPPALALPAPIPPPPPLPAVSPALPDLPDAE